MYNIPNKNGFLYLQGDELDLNIQQYLYNKIGRELVDDIDHKKHIKVLVVHHNDADGEGIKIIWRFLEEMYANITVEYKECSIKANEAVEPLLLENNTNYDYVFIADLSITEDYMDRVKAAHESSEFPFKFIILDHHVTAKYMNDYNFAAVIPHDIKGGIISSGTYMALEYLYPLIFMLPYGIMIQRLVKVCKLIAAYDTFLWDDDECRQVLGLEPLYINYILKSMKRKDFVEEFVYTILHGANNLDALTTNVFSKKHETIYSIMESIVKKSYYNVWHNMKVSKKGKYIIAVTYNCNYISEVGNEILRNIPEIDVMIFIDADRNSISLRTRKDNIDLSTIAKLHFGGGHQKAAGFPMVEEQKNYIEDTMQKAMQIIADPALINGNESEFVPLYNYEDLYKKATADSADSIADYIIL